jgi:hypothetical protein
MPRFVPLNSAIAPWVTRTRIEREGLLIVCRAADAGCRERGSKFEGNHSLRKQVSASRSHWGYTAPKRAFTLILKAPLVPKT